MFASNNIHIKYFRDCFFSIINHKFRSNLRVNCKIKHVDTVLICISGRNNSMSMLSMFNYTFFKDTTSNRKLFFKSKLLYIDDSFLYKDSNRKENINIIEQICKVSGFPYEIIMLENVLKVSFPDILKGNLIELDLTKEDENLMKNLEILIHSFPSII